ncbi:Nuclear factor related to kappa-B-binding [Gossypium arboreum]|uniref:Nuclear factor related to kappa-B-binding n=1 Tax=Gossypium arboreum TaxID=29729 RepID=A0A0B0NNC3_GOSAR|nr:Nuclear factor related to kappa-B-binding [Gossypium arboreum]
MRDATSSTDEDELQRPSSAINSDGAGDDDDEDDDDDEFDDADSGAGSDDFDLLELGEMGAEFCQVGNATCSVPFDLYDLPGLEDILSLDVWNECLSDEERFSLTKFLPDMDQDTFMWTLNDLLKGGLCEPRVALYREGLNFFQKRRHYHHLRMHQNNMVAKLCQTRDAWLNCRGYSIEERLRVLNIMRSQKILMYEKLEDEDSESSERGDFGEGLWSRRVKDQKALQKKGHHGVDPTLESVSRGQMVGLEPSEYRKQNPKGILKARGSKFPSAKEFGGGVYPGLDIDTEPYGLHGTLPRQKYKSGAANRTRDQMRLDDDGEDPMFGISIQQDRHAVHDSKSRKSGLLRAGKTYGLLRGEELAGDSFMALPPSSKHDLRAYGRNRDVNQFPDAKVYTSKPPNMRTPYDFAKKSKYSENHQQFAVGNQIKLMKGRTPQLPLKGSRFDLSERTELFWQNKNQGEDFSVDSSVRSDDWNIRSRKCKMGPECPDKASSQQMNDRFLFSDNRIKSSQEKIRGNHVQNGGPVMAVSKGSRAFLKNEETESDSSEQFDDDDDSNPLMRSKFDYPSGVIEGSRLSSLKSGLDSRKIKSSKKDTMEDGWPLDGINRISEKSFGENVHVPGVESYYFKGKQKSKMHEISPLQNSASRAFGKVDRKKVSKLNKSGQLGEKLGDRLKMSSTKAYPTEKRLKGEVVYDHPMSQRDYLLNYPVDEEDASPVTLPLADENNRCRTGKKGRSIETYDCGEKPEASLLGCKTGKEYVGDVDRRGEDGNLQSNLQKRTDDSLSLKKKGKRKLEVDAVTSDMEALEPHGAEVQVTDVEMEIKPQKKPFTLITPTVHTGFSFSIIHLLSAVRMAMITPLLEDSLEVGRPRREQNGKQEGGVNGVLEGGVNGVLSCENTATDPDQPVQRSIPSLTVQEIVNRVTVNPGDPCILETQEPLQDLVRGGQETLQQIGSLPAPPLELMQVNLDEKERFRDLRAQKSLNTISPSSEEVRAYFRREELLRYSIPDRAFSYTAADGKKSIVAPLRRGGGKPTSKARDHFMLKRDRPPHVTILCLVRDAASRLPGSIGTRADVCTLIRDSQYIVEEVSDAQVNQIVSGALDRLHYERDPCVQFDGERKLWVYLHREREEEDFEDDGTSSTKKWKRQKKDTAEQSDQGAVIAAFHAAGDQLGFDDDKKMETECEDRQNPEDNADDSHASEQGHPITWDPLDANLVQEDKLLCQENSTNEEFDDN